MKRIRRSLLLLTTLILVCTYQLVFAADVGKAIVVYKPDKTVSIIYPAPKSQRPKETDQEFLARVYQRSISNDAALKNLPYEIVNTSSLPSREFRDAWEGESGKGVRVNQKKAKQIQQEILRQQLIAEEKEKILEEQAIKRLKKAGKL